ncbi:MAG: trypsin-like peptidase domain-containing protein [Lutibacter sp.]|jgi:Do/DeqQ family serine protease|uniref:trypsin-like peptidase domain-containing protein n=1 Tax=Lutibacter sp. TaxID=1925666 RepID=UPI00299D1862|nr:trypsin-like peptidase domain-containing protein [Lutibacter sp.]MDX1829178.1 trypsin-like peptidase domain-containing protein [Lutibacter sp.]
MKKLVSIVLFSALGGAMTLSAYKLFIEKPQVVIEKSIKTNPAVVNTTYSKNAVKSFENTDFTVAAEKTLNAVVHVKNTSVEVVRDPFSEFFYGQGNGVKKFSQVGMGSGVIISPDGYIVTNNHVIRNATELEVTLNNKKVYKAKVIGSDSKNDIALLKIDATNLPHIVFGDSDAVKVGEWVLAVGNPYNLTSTVTAGIISAKGRDLDGNGSTDSFLQTDAAVNPGNSGGALVNSRGELVGINTAISSQTGSFIGYSFAVPSNIAKKVVEDIMEYGNVQRAMLGVTGGGMTNEYANKLGIDFTEGFYISLVNDNSGAKKAGLKTGDIITQVDNIKITSFADLTGYLNTKRPNDVVNVTYLRNGNEKNTNVKLIKYTINTVTTLGLGLENLNKKELNNLKIDNGVRIENITNKELLYYGVKKGYIITSINNQKVNSVDDVNKIISNRDKGEVLYIVMRNLNGDLERYIFR